MRLDSVGQGDSHVFAGEFTVPPGKHGEFHFFVNDALLPLDPGVKKGVNCASTKRHGWKFFQIGGRYWNNCGKARVTLTKLD